MIVAAALDDVRKSADIRNTWVDSRSGRRTPQPRPLLGLLALPLLVAAALVPASAQAAEGDAVRVWNANAITALTNATTNATPGAQFAPPVAIIQLAIVQGAVYDAVNGIRGGYDPYLGDPVIASSNASEGAAAATAAHDVLIALINQAPTTATLTSDVKDAIKARLDAEYASSLAEIPAGRKRTEGVNAGARAASAMLANRAGDGRFGAPGFPVSATPAPGEWRPLSTAPTANDPNGWVRSVRPFTLANADAFSIPGPSALTSGAYAREFDEVKALGRASGSTRTEAQTSLAYWSGANPVPFMFAGLRQVSVAKGLNIRQDARFLAMTSMASADTMISCWAQKARWNFWRPVTAIQLAADDGNPRTTADPAWTGLLPVPPYPEEPSGANCLTGGLMYAAAAFFRSDDAQFSLTSPGIGPGTGSTRDYSRFSAVVSDMIEARIYGGLHFRSGDAHGALLGRRVAQHVNRNFFNCGPPRACADD